MLLLLPLLVLVLALVLVVAAVVVVVGQVLQEPVCPAMVNLQYGFKENDNL